MDGEYLTKSLIVKEFGCPVLRSNSDMCYSYSDLSYSLREQFIEFYLTHHITKPFLQISSPIGKYVESSSSSGPARNSANIKSWRLRAERGTCRNTGPTATCRISRQCSQTQNSQLYRQVIWPHQHCVNKRCQLKGRTWLPVLKVPLV